MKRQPKIDEMVSFLEKFNMNALQDIKALHPDYQEALSPGEELGASEDLEELKMRATVCFAFLKTADTLCETSLKKLQKKLKATERLRLWGQILTTICGASVVTTLAAKLLVITYVSGSLSLFGALIPLVADQRSKGLDKTKDLTELYGEFVNDGTLLSQYGRELTFFLEKGFNVDGILDVINNCNKLCSHISEKQWLL